MDNSACIIWVVKLFRPNKEPLELGYFSSYLQADDFCHGRWPELNKDEGLFVDGYTLNAHKKILESFEFTPHWEND